VPVGGWLQDATGTARAPLLLSAALMLAGVVALAALRLLLRRGAPAPAPEAA
jgi:dipeptide/tripeptide permease